MVPLEKTNIVVVVLVLAMEAVGVAPVPTTLKHHHAMLTANLAIHAQMVAAVDVVQQPQPGHHVLRVDNQDGQVGKAK